jgi:hypothetical protein
MRVGLYKSVLDFSVKVSRFVNPRLSNSKLNIPQSLLQTITLAEGKCVCD